MNLFKSTVIFISILILFGSCSEKKNVKSISKSKITIETSEIKANRILNAEVQGMVCKMGCGASIRKELFKTNAIERCEIDYQEKRNPNFVTIYYDDSKVKSNKLVSIINNINEKQFKTGKIVDKERTKHSSLKVKKDKTKVSLNPTESEKHSLEKLNELEPKSNVAETPNDEQPNLLQLFSRFITG